MRARQRHLNARHAGAMFVLDARFINQSDNTAVSTWADRSGNGYDVKKADQNVQEENTPKISLLFQMLLILYVETI